MDPPDTGVRPIFSNKSTTKAFWPYIKVKSEGTNLVSVAPNHTHLHILQSQCLRTASYAPGKTQVPLAYVGRGVDFLATNEYSWPLTEVAFFSLAPVCEWKQLPFALSMVRIHLYRRATLKPNKRTILN